MKAHKGDEYPDQVVSWEKPATKLKEVRDMKKTQIVSKWNDTCPAQREKKHSIEFEREVDEHLW